MEIDTRRPSQSVVQALLVKRMTRGTWKIISAIDIEVFGFDEEVALRVIDAFPVAPAIRAGIRRRLAVLPVHTDRMKSTNRAAKGRLIGNRRAPSCVNN